MMVDYWAGYVVVAFMILDYVSGIAAAIALHSLSSSIMYKGLFNKFGYVIILVLATLIDWGETIIPMGFDVPVFTVVAVYISLIEVTSILENALMLAPELNDSGIMDVFFNNPNAVHGSHKVE